jgi:hypothetical protein
VDVMQDARHDEQSEVVTGRVREAFVKGGRRRALARCREAPHRRIEAVNVREPAAKLSGDHTDTATVIEHGAIERGSDEPLQAGQFVLCEVLRSFAAHFDACSRQAA